MLTLVLQNCKNQNESSSWLKSRGSDLVSSAVVVPLSNQLVHNNREVFYSLCFVLVELFGYLPTPLIPDHARRSGIMSCNKYEHSQGTHLAVLCLFLFFRDDCLFLCSRFRLAAAVGPHKLPMKTEILLLNFIADKN